MPKRNAFLLPAVLATAILAPAGAGAAQQPGAVALRVRPLTVSRDRVLGMLGRESDSSGTLRVEPRRTLIVPRSRPRVELAFARSPSREWLAAEEARTARVPGCLSAGSGDVATEGIRPWSDYDSLTAGLAYVLVQVTPDPQNGVPCPSTGAAAPGTEPLHFAVVSDVDSITAKVAGRPAPIALEGQVGAGSADRAWHQTREYLPVSALEPSRLGERPRIGLSLFGGGWAPADLTVPAQWVADAWRASIPARIARLRGSGRSVTRPVLPAPRDSVLRSAYVNVAPADPAASVGMIIERSLHVPLVPDDRRFSALYVGSVLAQLGDSAGGRAQYRDALAATPCLTLPATASAAERDMLDAVRPSVRCAVVSPTRMLVRGLMLPGGGERAAGRPRSGLAEAAVTAALFGGALFLDAQARAAHDDYLASTSAVEAPRLLAHANTLRHSASASAVAGAVSWVAFAASSWIMERIHATNTRAGREYGSLSESRPGTPTTEDVR